MGYYFPMEVLQLLPFTPLSDVSVLLQVRLLPALLHLFIFVCLFLFLIVPDIGHQSFAKILEWVLGQLNSMLLSLIHTFTLLLHCESSYLSITDMTYIKIASEKPFILTYKGSRTECCYPHLSLNRRTCVICPEQRNGEMNSHLFQHLTHGLSVLSEDYLC